MSIPYLKGRDYSSLAEALGMGIGNYAGAKLTDRAIEKAKASPEYSKGDLATKGTLLRKATSLYGNRGTQAAEQELTLEKSRGDQAMQQEYQRVSAVISDPNVDPAQKLAAINGSKLPLNDKKALAQSYNAFRRNEIADKKVGTTSSKFNPLPPEQLQAIEKVQSMPGYEDMTTDQKSLAYQKAGVNPEEVNKIIDRESEEENRNIKYNERSEKYIDEARTEAQQAENAITGIRQMEDALAKGETGYGVFRAFASGILPQNLMEQFLNKDEATFEAAIPNLLEGMKDLFGVRLSDADLRLVRGKLPSLGKSKEANEQIIGFLRNMSEVKKLKYKIAREEEKKYKKNRPASFTRDVEDKFEKEAAKIKDKYFAELRLPSTAVKKVKAMKIPQDTVRLVSPDGVVIDFNKNDKESIDALKNFDNYLILGEG